jgi:class 3 adenylate cyclase
MRPPLQFFNTRDGVRIACASIGSGEPLLFARGWMSNIELSWELVPQYRSYFEPLAEHLKVIFYDMRGNGLSDRNVDSIDIDDAVADLEAVADGLQLESFNIYGQCFGGPIAIAYAARHPERVKRLILDGTYSCGTQVASPEQQAKLTAMLRDFPEMAMLALEYYTEPEPAHDITLRQHYESQRRVAQYVTPEMAIKLYDFGFSVDVSDVLSAIRAPTLVMHRRENMAVPFTLGRELASQIEGARFVALGGSAANPWDGDFTEPQRIVAEFLGITLKAPQPATAAKREPAKGPLTILFTDMESSTANTQRLGDAGAQELLHTHNQIVRDALKTHGGTEIKHTGDGIMAAFASASAAVVCAEYIQRSFATSDRVRVRIGINAGEPVAEGDDLFGTAVQLARRVCDAGDPGDILVSNVVRELCAGKGFAFADRGVAGLKGFEEPVRLYSVAWERDA